MVFRMVLGVSVLVSSWTTVVSEVTFIFGDLFMCECLLYRYMGLEFDK